MNHQTKHKYKLLSALFISVLLIACKKETNAAPDKATAAVVVSNEASVGNQSNSSQQNSAIANTFLWKIEKAGQPTSYLLGTVHLGKINSVLPAHVLENFAKTDVLMTETRLDDTGEQTALAFSMLDLESTLSEKIGKERTEKLIPLLAAEGIPAQSVEQFQPWAAAVLLMYHKPEGYSQLFGVDILLTTQAQSTQKTLLGLETATEQIKLFQELPQDKMLSLIDSSINDSGEANKQTQKMLDMYEQNQADALFKLSRDEDFNLQNMPVAERDFWRQWLYQDLMDGRTAKWIPVIESQLPKQATFIAVGSGHLFGDKGLITLLRNKTYTVSPVMPK